MADVISTQSIVLSTDKTVEQDVSSVLEYKCLPDVPKITLCDQSQPIGLHELVVQVSSELSNGLQKADYSKIGQLMARFDAERKEWKRYAFFDKHKKYTRNLIATDNATFTLMLLCWTPGKASPVHDHAGSECFMRVIEGCVVEQQFAWAEKGKEHEHLKMLKETATEPGQVLFINDNVGLHKIENASSEPAITLHLYIPPYQECKCFFDENGQACPSRVTFYSENGQIVDYECLITN